MGIPTFNIQRLTMSKSIAYKHYIRALSRWPVDNLRPDCQFPQIMRKRLEQRFLPVSSQPSQTGNTQAQAVANSPIDEKFGVGAGECAVLAVGEPLFEEVSDKGRVDDAEE